MARSRTRRTQLFFDYSKCASGLTSMYLCARYVLSSLLNTRWNDARNEAREKEREWVSERGEGFSLRKLEWDHPRSLDCIWQSSTSCPCDQSRWSSWPQLNNRTQKNCSYHHKSLSPPCRKTHGGRICMRTLPIDVSNLFFSLSLSLSRYALLFILALCGRKIILPQHKLSEPES